MIKKLSHLLRTNIYAGTGLLLVCAMALSAAFPKAKEPSTARADWEARQEVRYDVAITQCAEAVRFGSRKAKLGWPAAGLMPGGDVMVRQPVTLAGETRTVRCVLRADDSFELTGFE